MEVGSSINIQTGHTDVYSILKKCKNENSCILYCHIEKLYTIWWYWDWHAILKVKNKVLWNSIASLKDKKNRDHFGKWYAQLDQNISDQYSYSVVSDSVIPWTAEQRTSLSFTNFQSLLKLISIKLVFHPTIPSSVIPSFSSCQSCPASGSFPRVSSSHQVAKVLELQLHHQSFQWVFRTNFP